MPELLRGNNMPPYLSRKNMQLAKKVRQRVTENLSSHLTIQQLSEELHASPTAIKSAFKNVYGEPVGEYRKSVRLQEAQRLLREADRPIAEIAEMVGYSNPGYFAVAFRGKFSMTPGDYKRLVRSKGNCLS